MKPLGSVRWCADECLGDEEMEECARLCRDVADIASLHARFMARNSNYSKQLAEACAGACLRSVPKNVSVTMPSTARSVPRSSRNAPRAVAT